MREITIISGKGGTGKTSLCASFAHLAQNAVICDLDVDVPDMHIILRPETIKTEDFIGGAKGLHQAGRLPALRHLSAPLPVRCRQGRERDVQH